MDRFSRQAEHLNTIISRAGRVPWADSMGRQNISVQPCQWAGKIPWAGPMGQSSHGRAEVPWAGRGPLGGQMILRQRVHASQQAPSKSLKPILVTGGRKGWRAETERRMRA